MHWTHLEWSSVDSTLLVFLWWLNRTLWAIMQHCRNSKLYWWTSKALSTPTVFFMPTLTVSTMATSCCWTILQATKISSAKLYPRTRQKLSRPVPSTGNSQRVPSGKNSTLTLKLTHVFHCRTATITLTPRKMSWRQSISSQNVFEKVCCSSTANRSRRKWHWKSLTSKTNREERRLMWQYSAKWWVGLEKLKCYLHFFSTA